MEKSVGNKEIIYTQNTSIRLQVPWVHQAHRLEFNRQQFKTLSRRNLFKLVIHSSCEKQNLNVNLIG